MAKLNKALGEVRHTAPFTVEGERDDSCAIGQTMAALDLRLRW